jgi:predicted pyridoxine 5'-phosphate oxidase superfamily flavin-nucleotide-binding protein
MYHDGSRELQDHFDTRRLADRINEKLVHAAFTDDDREFIARMDMFFLATADAEGRPTCSYKGGAQGFARVLDDRTLAFPSYDGNGMFMSLGNAARNPNVSLLFVDFVNAWRMRVDGAAEVSLDDPLLSTWPEAQAVVRVTPRAIYPQCPRYVHKMTYAEHSPYVPTAGVQTPIPDWKRADWAADVLAADDPARHP